VLIICSFLTIIGFAGFGYLTNDLSDRKKDNLVQKKNATTKLNRTQVLMLFALFLSLALIPWTYLPLDKYSWALIILELSLFVIYAFSPFRLKERGALGVVVDAMYAHALPAVLASYTFYLATNMQKEELTLFIILLFTWQLISGIRNILSHQLKDYENDIACETKTFVTAIGKNKTVSLLSVWIVPLEVATFMTFFAIVCFEMWWLSFALLPHVGIASYLFLRGRKEGFTDQLKLFTWRYLDDFYIKWLPFGILISGVFYTLEIRFILLLHIVLFSFYPWKWSRFLLNRFKATWLKRILFDYKSYFKGLFIHFALIISYSLLFVILYFWGEENIANDLFFEWQKDLSLIFLSVLFVHVLSVIILRWKQTVNELRRFFLEPNSAYNLAILRILVFAIVVPSMAGEGFGRFLSWTYLPDSQRVPLPFIGWWVENIPISPGIYKTILSLGIVFGFASLIGLWTKWSTKLFVLTALYVWSVPSFYGKLNHYHIMIWVPMILAFSKCSDVWSIDAYIRKRKVKKKDPVISWKYGLPTKGIWLLLGLIYFASGVHKLWDVGLYWALSDNLSNQIQLEWVENYDRISSFRIDNYPVVLKMSGMMVIMFEILYPIFLLRKQTRWFNFIGAYGLHMSAGYFMNIDFVHLRQAHFTLINFDWVRRRLGHSVDITKEEKISIKSMRSYSVVYVIGILFLGNTIMSISSTSTYPFSTYPSYTVIVPDTVTIIGFDARTSTGEYIDVKKLGQHANFRWENIRPFEQNIFESHLDGNETETEMKMKEYWSLWCANVPSLNEVVEVEMTLITTLLKPEERDEILSIDTLGVIHISR
jgi:1,4-dihydroxy-2-naphthoate octaprenyltransferase